MGAYRITKILCPCCKGDPSDMLFGHCAWCNDTKRMSVEGVHHYSQHVWMIAGGGYIAGDHDLEDCRRMEGEADAMRKLAGLCSIAELRPRPEPDKEG